MKKIKLFREFFDQEDLKAWNPDRFKVKRKPIRIAEIKEKEEFSKPNKISVLDMVIKLPQGEIKVPFKSKSINEIIDRVLEHEKEINPNWENYYIYLTLHQSFVKKGDSQRRGGAHFDGMQGKRYKEKLPTCHSYIVSDAIPTIFHTNEFDPTDLTYNDNWFKKLSKQVDPKMDFIIKPYNIYFMTSYHLHSAVPTTEDTFRTFVRVEFSLKKFDREDNTRNKLLPVNWDFKERDIPKGLNESKDTQIDKLKSLFLYNGWKKDEINDLEEDGYFSSFEFINDSEFKVYRNITILEDEVEEFESTYFNNDIGEYWSLSDSTRAIWGDRADGLDDKRVEYQCVGSLDINNIDWDRLREAFDDFYPHFVEEKEIRTNNTKKNIEIQTCYKN